ncbi:MAG: HesA/MoeB/ThiF family protein [Bacteroidota bacterium]
MENLFEVHNRLIGKKSQTIIQTSKVTIIGVGGLGCTVAQNIVRLGVANVLLVDSDKIETSNLPRQILFNKNDVGNYKAEIAKQKLDAFSPKTKIKIEVDNFTYGNGKRLLSNSDVIIDCTDNYPSRYAISKSSKELNIPMVYGGVKAFEGQVGVFNYKGSKSFHEAFPKIDNLMRNETCEASGVLPFVVQIIGAMQVAEFFKIRMEDESVLINSLLCVNTLTGTRRVLKL